MADLHVSSQLISAAVPVAAVTAIPGDPAAQPGAVDAFAALLAGKLAPQEPNAIAAARKPGTTGAVQTQATLQTAGPVPSAPLTDLATTGLNTAAGAEKDPKDDADTTPSADAASSTPDPTTQLLAALLAATPAPAAALVAQSGAGTPPGDKDPKGSAAKATAAAGSLKPAPEVHAPGRHATASPDTLTGTTEKDAAPSAAFAPANAAPHANTAAEHPVTLAAQMAQPDMPQALHQGPPSAVSGLAPAPTPTPAVQMSVPGPIGTPLWREEFAASVSLLATQRVSSAELRMQPAEMGPVQVSIRIEGGEASITCAAQHADTRHALETALPRLREMLESNGISVGNTSVGTHPQNAGGSASWGNPGDRSASGQRATEDVRTEGPAFLASQASHAPVRSDRLLDVFA